MEMMSTQVRRHWNLGTRLLRFVVLGIDEDHVVCDDARGHSLRAILVRNLAVVDATLDDRSLSLPQVLQNRVSQCRLEHDDPVPVGALGPISGLESGKGFYRE